jgi:DNA-binding Lrp family transcriptional regulator
VGPNYEIYYWDRGLRRIDTGRIIGLDDKRLRLLNALKKANEPKKLMERTKLTPQAVAKYLKELVEAGLATEKDGKYRPAGKLDLPETLDSPAFSGLEEKFPLSKAENPEVEEAMVDEKQVSRIPQLFGNCRVKSVETILKPVWKAAYKSAKGVRVEKIDAIG